MGELHDAVMNGNMKEVKKFLKRGSDVNERNMSDLTPLLLAAGLGQYSPGRKGYAPANSTEIAKHLISNGAEVTTRGGSVNSVGRTALHGFVENGDTEVASLLIEHGADVDATDMDGRTPLHLAARWGYPEMANLLIEKGADVNSRVLNGATPLYLATLNKHDKLAELLQHHGGSN